MQELYDWIGEKWHDAIKNALFGFLMNRSFEPMLNIDIKIHSIKSHHIHSSYAAFHAVTEQALEIAFGLRK